MRGGKRAGAGRKRNVPNRASANREREAAASGATPLDVMLRSMRSLLALADESAGDRKQFEHYIRAAAGVAKDAAPYLHSRFSTIDQSTANKPDKIIVEVRGGLPIGSTPERPEGTEYDEVPPEEPR
jgi:hypothetical protein